MLDLQQALAEWGSTMGMPDLAPGPQGDVQLRFPETGALLGVVLQDEWAIVHHATPAGHDAAALLLRAMRQAAKVADPAQAVQVGLRSTPAGDWLVLVARFPQQELSGARIHHAVEFLRQWLAQLDQ